MAGKGLPGLLRSNNNFALAALRRHYAVQASGPPRFQIFNRRTKWLQKERAAANAEQGREADYLKDEVARRVAERLLVCIQCSPRKSVIVG
jgi:NADH dehydrogenase [ubiquinone] 1 alpha subcomplex assembly factor 5